MECRTARLLLDFNRPLSQELPGEDAEALQSHLADCPECGLLARADRLLDHHLGQVMRDVPVPAGLRAKLLKRLDIERHSHTRRRWVPWTVGLTSAAAAAAAVMLWFGLGHNPLLPKPNLDEQSFAVQHQVNSTPEQVEQWFQDTYQIKTVAPTQFDNRLLAFYDLAEFQGKRVPMLLFIREDGSRARVYILSETQFDLSGLAPTPGYDVTVIQNPSRHYVAYVVFFDRGPLEPFLKGSEKAGTGT